MTEFKIGDRVVLKSREKLTHAHWKGQEVGVGIVTEIPPNDPGWYSVVWEDNEKNGYKTNDLIKVNDMTDTITLKKADLLKAWQEGCSDTRKALELLYPGELPIKEGPTTLKKGMVFVRGLRIPYIMTSLSPDDLFVLVNLTDGWSWHNPQTAKALQEDFDEYVFRPMTSGTITITVKDGKAVSAVVKED